MNNKDQMDKIFTGIQLAFVEGQVRRLQSETTTMRLFDFLVKLRSNKSSPDSAEALSQLHNIPQDNFLSAAYLFDALNSFIH